MTTSGWSRAPATPEAPSGAPPTLAVDRVEELFGVARAKRVLVVGDVMVDRYIMGRVERISPEAPVPVLRVEGEESRPGGAANVAMNIAALGASCELVGCSGVDEGRLVLERALASAGIGADGIVSCPDRPTTTKTRLVARSQQVARFDHENDGPVSADVERQLLERLEHALARADAVALEDYNKGVLTRGVIRALLDGARERGVPVVVDPKRHHFFEFAGATVFKPNLRELEDATGAPPRLGERGWLDEVRERTGAEHLLLTLGEAGMILHGPSGPERRLSATARSVYDVSGAGDTVTATMAVALASGTDVAEAAILANLAAGIGVGKAGVVSVSPAEILAEASRLPAVGTSGSPHTRTIPQEDAPG